MPSFDAVSEVDAHELKNAVDQANKEIANRFDFRGLDLKFELKEKELIMYAPEEFHLKEMYSILQTKLHKRGIDILSLDPQAILKNLSQARQTVKIKQGIEKEAAKTITAFIKKSNLKVQASILEDVIRVTGKKRDDLQEAIAMLQKENFKQPLQFKNFRD